MDRRESLGVLVVIALAQLFALTLWFSATAVAPVLQSEWSLSVEDVGQLTMAVQLGFVVGALSLALLNVPDLVPSRYLFAVTAFVGATVNALITLLGQEQFGLTLFFRFLTGVSLAGVYPSGLKVMAGWYQKRRGLALGVLVGALTVGSATPHLIKGMGMDWQVVLWTASGLCVFAALMMLCVPDGPYETKGGQFRWSLVVKVFGNRRYRLATAGYLGHMWELYAMWAWIAAWLSAYSATHASVLGDQVPTLTFAVIAIGAVGCWLAGIWSDRVGRPMAAGASMVTSGLCAVATPLVFLAPVWLVVLVLLVWGFSVVADSAQFSALVTEVVEDELRGTALTLQTALGFCLTLVSIRLVPWLAQTWGWQWSFCILAIGPALGAMAMARIAAVGRGGRVADGNAE